MGACGFGRRRDEVQVRAWGTEAWGGQERELEGSAGLCSPGIAVGGDAASGAGGRSSQVPAGGGPDWPFLPSPRSISCHLVQGEGRPAGRLWCPSNTHPVGSRDVLRHI